MTTTTIAPIAVAPHPRCYFIDVGGLREYLRARGIEHEVGETSLRLWVSEGVDAPVLQVDWLAAAKQARFTVGLGASARGRVALVDAAARANTTLGYPVWQVDDGGVVVAAWVALLNHDGTLSSRVFESAVALLRGACARSADQFRSIIRDAGE